jgi:hypothetical protein
VIRNGQNQPPAAGSLRITVLFVEPGIATPRVVQATETPAAAGTFTAETTASTIGDWNVSAQASLVATATAVVSVPVGSVIVRVVSAFNRMLCCASVHFMVV